MIKMLGNQSVIGQKKVAEMASELSRSAVGVGQPKREGNAKSARAPGNTDELGVKLKSELSSMKKNEKNLKTYQNDLVAIFKKFK